MRSPLSNSCFSLSQEMKLLRQGYWNVEHFIGETTGTLSLSGGGYFEISTLNGTSNVTAPIQADSYGVARLTIPDDASGGEEAAGMRQSNQVGRANGMFGPKLSYSARHQVDAPPGVGQEYSIAFGLFQPETAQRVSSDGVYWLADETSANWFLVSSRSGVQTTADSGVAVATNTWQVLDFTIDTANNSVSGSIDGVPVATVNPVNVQPATTWTSEWIINGAALATRGAAVAGHMDWLAWGWTYPDA